MRTERFLFSLAFITMVAIAACGDARELVSGSDLSVLETSTLRTF
jgi:hypothetical protein